MHDAQRRVIAAVEQLRDVTRAEVRVAWEKGKTGRVLPVAAWAMSLVAHYIQQARPLILNGRESEALFPSIHSPRMKRPFLGSAEYS